MGYLIVILILVRTLIAIFPLFNQWVIEVCDLLRLKVRRYKNAEILNDYFLNVNAFYVAEFGKPPSMHYITCVDQEKVLDYIRKGQAGKVVATYERRYFNWQRMQQEIGRTIFKIAGRVIIEVGDDYVKVLFASPNSNYADKLMEVFTGFKAPEKEEDQEINIITLTSSGLDLKQLDIKPVELDLDLYYNDDFKAVDNVIEERLSRENDKGIVLLHGLPGTGKTTYLRHLIGKLKKRILFVSPSVASNLMNPEFIDLLIDNPNAILVIEDAENIIMERKYSSHSSVSNLLNISDGLLSDCLNVQIICTFNSALNLVDSALLRKGRLIAKYEFGKLDVDKAQRLSDHLGLEHKVFRPMTLAEITNPGEAEQKPIEVSVIGFRRLEEMVQN